MKEQRDASVEDRWRSWAESALGGSPNQVSAATAAATQVVESGGAQRAAIRAAKQAWEGAAQPVPPPAGRAVSAQTGAAAALPVEGERQAPSAPPSAPIRPRERAVPPTAGVRGRVSEFQTRAVRKQQTYFVGAPPGQPQISRTRWITLTVWTFRVAAVVVEMTGRRFKGTIRDGDEVQVDRTPKRGKTLRIKRLENLTTGETVRAKGGPPVGTAKLIIGMIQLAVLVAVVAVLVVIVVVFLTVVLPHLKHFP